MSTPVWLEELDLVGFAAEVGQARKASMVSKEHEREHLWWVLAIVRILWWGGLFFLNTSRTSYIGVVMFGVGTSIWWGRLHTIRFIVDMDVLETNVTQAKTSPMGQLAACETGWI
jgi:uncharacterized membrane protein YgcG